MIVLPRNRALHAMDEEQASGKEVFPRTRKGREDEKLPEGVIGVVCRAQRTALRRYRGIEGGRDPDKEQLYATARCIRLLPDVAGNPSMASTGLATPNRVLNLLPRVLVNGHHECCRIRLTSELCGGYQPSAQVICYAKNLCVYQFVAFWFGDCIAEFLCCINPQLNRFFGIF